MKRPPPSAQLAIGQYELGKLASLMPKSALYASAATAIEVPLIKAMNVPKRATDVIIHFLRVDQLNLQQCSVDVSSLFSWKMDARVFWIVRPIPIHNLDARIDLLASGFFPCYVLLLVDSIRLQ